MCLLNVLGTPRHSVQADEITFNAAISACEKTDRWDMAPSGFEIVQGCAGHGVVKHLFFYRLHFQIKFWVRDTTLHPLICTALFGNGYMFTPMSSILIFIVFGH